MYNILIFGDSVVAGRCVEKNKSWVSLLVRSFDAQDKNNTLIYNLGIPGESTEELLRRFEMECRSRTQKRSPKDTAVIVISVGINDSKGISHPKNYRTSPQIFQQNISNLIKLAKKYTDKVIFIGLTPVNEDKTAPLENNYFLNSSIKKYNNNIMRICSGNKIPFVEIFGNFMRKDYNKFLYNHGIHPNELAHKKIF